jgi:hypothetical protein
MSPNPFKPDTSWLSAKLDRLQDTLSLFIRDHATNEAINAKLAEILTNQTKAANNQTKVLQALDRMEKLIMGLKEDFATFVVAVNERTNEIAAALDEIKTDIEGLLNPNTPPETAAAMADIQAKLTVLSDTSKAIAALNNPVVPPPVEPPPDEPL